MSLSPLGATCLLLTLQALTGLSAGQSRPRLSATVTASDLNVIILRCDGGPAGLLPSYHSRVGNVNRNITLSSETTTFNLAIVIDVGSEGYYYCQVGDFRSEEVPLVGKLH